MIGPRLVALVVLVTACTPLPPPWTPPAEDRAPVHRAYLGRPHLLAFSADGNVLAIISRSFSGSGVALVDGREGHLIAARDYPGQHVEYAALSADGARLATLRSCDWHLGPPCTPAAPFILAEANTRDPAGPETILLDGWRPDRNQRNERVWAFAYDRRDANRLLILTAGTFMFHHSGSSIPVGPFRLLAVARRDPARPPQTVGDWMMDGFAAIGQPSFAPDGSVRLVSWPNGQRRGSIVEVVLRPGESKPASVLPARRHRSPGLRLAAGWWSGAPILGVVTHGTAGREHQDLLVEGDDDAETGFRLLTQHEAAIPHVAMSADGRRAAFVVLALQGSDPQPVLYLLDLAAPDGAVVRRTAALADAGIGRTEGRARMSEDDLLHRLKALLDRPDSLFDAALVGRTLGVRAAPAPNLSGAPGSTIEGELAPRGSLSHYLIRSTAGPEGTRTAELRLVLGAGPCLTVPEVERVFGQSPGPDVPDTGIPPSPRSQPRWYLRHTIESGSAYFSFRQQHCASWVNLAQRTGG